MQDCRHKYRLSNSTSELRVSAVRIKFKHYYKDKITCTNVNLSILVFLYLQYKTKIISKHILLPCSHFLHHRKLYKSCKIHYLVFVPEQILGVEIKLMCTYEPDLTSPTKLEMGTPITLYFVLLHIDLCCPKSQVKVMSLFLNFKKSIL